ncbi:hypothetical protein C8Q74DRAFT_103109 [Fomes fomentarius]|nr:hypothetical protein C8Q74DRAFT_103109 [Fomes fomentarius]
MLVCTSVAFAFWETRCRPCPCSGGPPPRSAARAASGTGNLTAPGNRVLLSRRGKVQSRSKHAPWIVVCDVWPRTAIWYASTIDPSSLASGRLPLAAGRRGLLRVPSQRFRARFPLMDGAVYTLRLPSARASTTRLSRVRLAARAFRGPHVFLYAPSRSPSCSSARGLALPHVDQSYGGPPPVLFRGPSLGLVPTPNRGGGGMS